jgi:hypothetical protein
MYAFKRTIGIRTGVISAYAICARSGVTRACTEACLSMYRRSAPRAVKHFYNFSNKTIKEPKHAHIVADMINGCAAAVAEPLADDNVAADIIKDVDFPAVPLWRRRGLDPVPAAGATGCAQRGHLQLLHSA